MSVPNQRIANGVGIAGRPALGAARPILSRCTGAGGRATGLGSAGAPLGVLRRRWCKALALSNRCSAHGRTCPGPTRGATCVDLDTEGPGGYQATRRAGLSPSGEVGDTRQPTVSIFRSSSAIFELGDVVRVATLPSLEGLRRPGAANDRPRCADARARAGRMDRGRVCTRAQWSYVQEGSERGGGPGDGRDGGTRGALRAAACARAEDDVALRSAPPGADAVCPIGARRDSRNGRSRRARPVGPWPPPPVRVERRRAGTVDGLWSGTPGETLRSPEERG